MRAFVWLGYLVNLQGLCLMGILDKSLMIKGDCWFVYALYFTDIIPESNSVDGVMLMLLDIPQIFLW